MTNGWVTKPLNECLEKTGTVDPRKSPQAEFDYIDVSSVSNKTFQIHATQRLAGKDAPSRARKLVRANDILFATVRPLLQRIAVVPKHLDKQVCSTGYVVLRPKAEIDSRFLFYSLFTERFTREMTNLQRGASYPAVTDRNVMAYAIRLPPLPEQKRIAALLDEAFTGIAAAKANAEKNIKNARAVFGDHLHDVFSQKNNGAISTTVGAVCRLRSGTTVPKGLEKPTGDIPYLKVADMSFEGNETQITGSSRFLNEKDVKAATIIPPGATIFPKRGGAILTNKKRLTSVRICADLNIMAVIPSSKIDSGLLYYYFLNIDMKKLGNGSAIPQINNYDIDPLVISFPESISEQLKIVEIFRALQNEIGHLTDIYAQKKCTLDELEKSLLHEAFRGAL